MHHSRRTLAIIRENNTFSLGVKVVFVMLSFAGMGAFGGERQEFLSMID
jgi:cation transport ATPase